MAGGHDGHHGQRRRSSGCPNELLLDGNNVSTTNESSPSDEHYELASDQLTLADDSHNDVTQSSHGQGTSMIRNERKSDEDTDDSIKDGKEEDEVNVNSAFALDILGRKTGIKPKQLTKFNENINYIELRSDSEEDNQVNEFEEENNDFSGDANNGIRKQQTPTQTMINCVNHDGQQEQELFNGLLTNGHSRNDGPLDTRLRTNEEKRRALELAFQANKLARCGHYDEAVRLLTQSIMINENDYRFFVNRSYCYDSLGNFKSALVDADRAILLNSEWPKGHFRRGRALAGLCKFKESEESFLKVVQLDPDAQDEIDEELMKIRINAVMMIGGTSHENAVAIASKFNRVTPTISFAVKYCCLNNSTNCEDQNGQFIDASQPSFANVMTPIGPLVRQKRRSLAGTPLEESPSLLLPPGLIINRPLEAPIVTLASTTSSFGILSNSSEIDRHFAKTTKEGHQVTDAHDKDDLLSDSESYHGPPSPTPSLPILDSFHSYNQLERERHYSGRAPSECYSSSAASVGGENTPTTTRFGRSASDTASPEMMAGTDVTNPFQWKALWVGNVSSTCPEKLLRTMFGQFGQLSYCSMYPVEKKAGTAFALVHYDNPTSPCKAMSEFQGVILKGVSANDKDPLVIRFRPSKEQKKKAGGLPGKDPIPPTSTTSGGVVGKLLAEKVPLHECYYWRTTGCRRGSECIYSHVEKHRGVDFQPWMTGCDRHLLSKQGTKPVDTKKSNKK